MSRKVHDSMGELTIPDGAHWQAQTQRAIENFGSPGGPMPAVFITELARLKAAAATTNEALGELPVGLGAAIVAAAKSVIEGAYADQFPVDRYQTGSGTSTNMNMNEVLATLASKSCSHTVHPNDHVNRGQSSNDVIPTTLQISVAVQLVSQLKPAISNLAKAIDDAGYKAEGIVKTGRTHLMDAMPLTLQQEFSAFSWQLREQLERIDDLIPRLCRVPLGGTAVGTGVNCHPKFAATVASALALETGLPIRIAENRFARMAALEAPLEASAVLQSVAMTLTKICNDLRWMNSGPNSGLAEIRLPPKQPGSSIMPGKVNPVIPEAVLMMCAQVNGMHTANQAAAQSGNFQLNVMLPLVAANLLDGMKLLCCGMRNLATNVFAGIEVNSEQIGDKLSRNPILVTALNSLIGYELAAKIAKRAQAENRPLMDVALEETQLSKEQLQELLDPTKMF